MASGLRALAGPVRKDPVQNVEGLPDLLGVGVRPEVDDPATVTLAREHHARVFVLRRDGYVGERLVVAEPDVEGRPVALDEVLLEVQRLDLVLGDDHLDVLHSVGQLLDGRAGVLVLLKVRTDARAQGLGLAHVEDVPRLVPKEVDARLGRERFQLGFEPRGHMSSLAPPQMAEPRNGKRPGWSGRAAWSEDW